jgi:hypothetical protein
MEDIDATWILAESRFDATNVAIWADSPVMTYALFGAGSQIAVDQIPAGKKVVVTTGDILISDLSMDKFSGDGFTVYTVED